MPNRRVLAITSGRDTPSARFRFRQYYPELERHGLAVDESCPRVNNGARLPGLLGRVRMRYVFPVAVAQVFLNLALRASAIVRQFRCDVTWVERHFVPGADFLGVLLKRPYVLDLDDAVWLYNPFGERMTALLVRRATGVIAGNATVADWCRQYNTNVREIPTAIDCSRFVPGVRNEDVHFVLGWTGTSVNFDQLRMIESVLAAFLASEPAARLRVVADRRPQFNRIPASSLEFVQWSPEVEAEAVATMDVGLMPLFDNPVTRGKCSFKMLQYMACAKPVVVSPVGLNSQILAMGHLGYGPSNEEAWLVALKELRADRDLCSRLGQVGRQVALERFDTRVIARQVADFLQQCARN
jgi:glycosyltransferase involved in cell wall biosynthesis